MYKCELYTLSKDLDSVNLLREKSGAAGKGGTLTLGSGRYEITSRL